MIRNTLIVGGVIVVFGVVALLVSQNNSEKINQVNQNTESEMLEVTDTNNSVEEVENDESSVDDVTGTIEAQVVSEEKPSGLLCGRVMYMPGAQGFDPSPVQTTVEVRGAGGNVIASKATDENGEVQIAVPSGTYTIAETTYGQTVLVETRGSGCSDFTLTIDAPSAQVDR